MEKELNGERGVVFENVRLMGGDASPKLKSYFSDILVEMTSVTIENVRSFEIIGIRSLLKLQKSTFYLIYPNDLFAMPISFLLLEKSELIVNDFLFMGDIDEFNTEESKDNFLICNLECKITISQLSLQKIFLNQVITIKF